MNITLETVKDAMQKLEKETWSKGVVMQIVKDKEPAVYNEYMKEKKEKAVERTKHWRMKNPDKVKEYKKKYEQKQTLCECGKMVKNKSKTNHLKSEDHKRRMEQKDKTGEAPKIDKHTCECGGSYTGKNGKWNHQQTSRHKSYFDSINKKIEISKDVPWYKAIKKDGVILHKCTFCDYSSDSPADLQVHTKRRKPASQREKEIECCTNKEFEEQNKKAIETKTKQKESDDCINNLRDKLKTKAEKVAYFEQQMKEGKPMNVFEFTKLMQE
jgi:hypothetical protein